MTRYQLIDVSVWQGVIDWEKVKPNIDGVLIRCSNGASNNSTPDPQFERNATECERLGIPYGVYVFSYANNEIEAQKEAVYCLKFITGKKLSYPVFYDSEGSGQLAKNARKCAEAFIKEIEFAGIPCGIYCNRSWYNNNFKNFDCRYLWIAAWNNTGAGVPCDIWQYSNNGRVDGISGRVDMDVCYRDIPSEIFQYKPEKPKKTIEELAQEVLDGKWGNGNARKKALTEAGYDYQKVQDKVNEIIYGRTLKVGSVIMIRQGAKQYGKLWGFAAKVYQRKYYVKQINGERVVFGTKDGVIMGAVARKDCIVV